MVEEVSLLMTATRDAHAAHELLIIGEFYLAVGGERFIIGGTLVNLTISILVCLYTTSGLAYKQRNMSFMF